MVMVRSNEECYLNAATREVVYSWELIRGLLVFVSTGFLKVVADSGFGNDILGLGGVQLYLLAQM